MGQRTEAVVLGGGPGGYVAAIRLGQLGKETLLIEKGQLGGVCVNIGCIPSKALIRVAKLKKRVEAAKQIGFEVTGLKVDFPKVQAWKQSVVDRLTQGVEYLCKANNVRVIKGTGTFTGPKQLDVKTSSGVEKIEAEHVVIAAGSRYFDLPTFRFDGTRIISSTEALSLQEVPKNLVIIGGGVTGLEMGTMYSQLGSRVTIIEMLEQLLPGTDIDLVKVVERSLRKQGVDYHVKSKAKEFRDGKVYAQLEDGKEAAFDADKVLVVVGRRPNSDQVGLQATGVATDSHGFIKVDKRMQTNVPGIYAIGDIVGPPMLAHKASKEGAVAAEAIAGLSSEADFRAIAGVIFSDPEIATVGLTETQAREKGHEPI
jgi:dihydrolipoamide dehydrogenase